VLVTPDAPALVAALFAATAKISYTDFSGPPHSITLLSACPLFACASQARIQTTEKQPESTRAAAPGASIIYQSGECGDVDSTHAAISLTIPESIRSTEYYLRDKISRYSRVQCAVPVASPCLISCQSQSTGSKYCHYYLRMRRLLSKVPQTLVAGSTPFESYLLEFNSDW
jgi:hypothetical protein